MSKTDNIKKQKIKKEKLYKKKIIISVIAILIIIICVTAIFLSVKFYNLSYGAQLVNHTWVPPAAKDSSGDEVNLNELYDTYYTNYQGSLEFAKDGSFTLWITPGDISDGTHSGTYQLEDDTINVTFDEGTENTFNIIHNSSGIDSILVKYNDYEITFSKN